MKQIVFLISAIAMALAGPDPSCMPQNLPKDANFADCCQMKVEMIPPEVMKKCESTIPKPSGPPTPNDGKPQVPPIEVMCGAECALKELKIWVDGNIDKSAAINQLSSKDASVKPAVESAVNYCMDKSKEIGPPPNGTHPPPPCSFIPMFVASCVYGQLYKNCGSKIVAKDECAKLSEFAKKCDWIPPMKCKTEN